MHNVYDKQDCIEFKKGKTNTSDCKFYKSKPAKVEPLFLLNINSFY